MMAKRVLYLGVLLLGIAVKANAVDPIPTRVGPILWDKTKNAEILWDQTAPYNNQCPLINGRPAYVGCGATAIGQIMKYHSYPAEGVGERNGCNFGETTYEWNNMLPTYAFNKLGTDAEKFQVAQLLRHIGAAMNMVYTADGSGSASRQIVKPLQNFFSYKGRMEMAFKQAYTDDEWFQLIKREIDSGRPIVYAGGAHIYTCDGYDTNGKLLHFNYGWDGRYNEWCTVTGGKYKTELVMLLGIHPTESDAFPSIVMLTPFNFSTYNVKKNTTFDVATRVTNYGVDTFNGEVGVALYKGDRFVKVLGNNQSGFIFSMTPSDPENSAAPRSTYDILLMGVKVDPVADGDYILRLVTKLPNNKDWCPMQGLVKDVYKEMYVKVTDGNTSFSYPLGLNDADEQLDLELASQLEVNVQNNRGTATFSIKNMDLEYDCEGADVYVVVSPNNLLIPATWKKMTIEKLDRGLSRNYTISDIPIPAGSSVSSCRFSVAYSRLHRRLDNGRDVTAVPLFPDNLNMVTYEVPAERETFSIDFKNKTGVPIPDGYKMYDKDAKEDLERKEWRYNVQGGGYAVAFGKESKLVTTAIHVPDENAVLEWGMMNMSAFPNTYRIYISTEGQDYTYFKELKPAYNVFLPDKSVARMSLADYAGKDIYVMFERVKGETTFALWHIKVLNIKTPKDISIQSVNIPGTSLPSERFPVTLTVKNHSALNVKKVKASYQIGSKSVEEEFVCDIPFNQQTELTFSELVTVSGQAGDVITLTAKVELAGEDGDELKNNNGSAQNKLVNFYPRKKMLYFKSSKAGCQACKTSYGTLDHLEWVYPDVMSGVEVWRDGSFKSDDFALYASGTTPTFFMNANHTPEFAPNEVLDAARKTFKVLSPPAEVYVQAAYENESSRKMKIKVKSHFATPMQGEYRMGAFIIENNVLNIDGQISGTHPTGEKLTKNHVPVGTVGGCKGETGKLITDPNTKEEYVYECDFTIPDEKYTKEGVSYRNRRDNIQVIGVLFDAQGKVLNTALSCFYIRFPKTEGLTFVAEAGYCPFKPIYEIGEVAQDVFSSLERYRATIPVGESFKFSIKQSGDWTGKTVRLVVNRRAVYNNYNNVDKEEVLLPDASGVYTITDAQKHYFIEIEELAHGGPTLTQKGTELVLTGNWTADHFKRLHVGFPSLTGVDMTAIEIPEMPVLTSVLNVANPNVLVYTAANAAVPTTWKNVVKGDRADNITLTDGYTFYNSRAFAASSATYSRVCLNPGWASVCLPFAVSALPESVKAERFLKSVGSTIEFEKVSSMNANTPYILDMSANGVKVFGASDVTIPMTTVEKVQEGGYSFEGNFTDLFGSEVEGLFILHYDGTGFRKANDSNTISAFRAYIRDIAGSGETKLNVTHVDAGATNVITDKLTDELIIRSSNGVVEIITTKAQQIAIHSIEGRLVRLTNLNEGSNSILDLPKGVYLIGNRKLIVK